MILFKSNLKHLYVNEVSKGFFYLRSDNTINAYGRSDYYKWQRISKVFGCFYKKEGDIFLLDDYGFTKIRGV